MYNFQKNVRFNTNTMKCFLLLLSVLSFLGTDGWCYPVLDSKNGNLADDCFNTTYNTIQDKHLLEAMLIGKTNSETKMSDFCKHLKELVTHMDECWIDFVKAFDHYLSSHLNTTNGMINLSGSVQELIEKHFGQTSNINFISMPIAQLVYQMAYLDDEKLKQIKTLENDNQINPSERSEKMNQLLKTFLKKDYDTFCEQSLVAL